MSGAVTVTIHWQVDQIHQKMLAFCNDCRDHRNGAVNSAANPFRQLAQKSQSTPFRRTHQTAILNKL